jgi:hypothetical protein
LDSAIIIIVISSLGLGKFIIFNNDGITRVRKLTELFEWIVSDIDIIVTGREKKP